MPSAAEEIEALRAALAAAEARAVAAEAQALDAARDRAVLSGAEALIAALRLEIEKLKRALYGVRSERKARLLDQLELQLEELEAAATEDELAVEAVARPNAPASLVRARRGVGRKPFPAHLPRERVVIAAPCRCEACGSKRIVKLGEDVTDTLEVVPRQWKVIQTVREKFTCRDCERISQPPAPFHPTPRGWAGPNLLATVLFEKFGQHQPLNRQAERYAREGVELSLSTLADQVGAAAAALAPLHGLIAAHVLAAERLHGDDTPVPVLAKGKTDTGRLWVYVRDDRPFAGGAPPAALYRFSRDRRGEHPLAHLAGWSGILQADAYAGFGGLYAADRQPGPITGALCWAHARRKFFELADIAASARRGKQAPPVSPTALEAVKRIDTIFDAERAINGLPAEARLYARRAEIAPLVADLEAWIRRERAALSRHAPVAKAMDYMLRRWDGFASWGPRFTSLALAVRDSLTLFWNGDRDMKRQPGLFDMEERLRRLSDIGDQLEAFTAVVDFERFRPDLDAALGYGDGSKGGRPPLDPVMMFKILVIQAQNNLSDDRTEFLINDRLSFMRFLGLGLSDRVPDAKTIWSFRERLTKAGAIKALFARFDQAIREAGYIPMSGQIVDASLVSAPRQRNTAAEKAEIKAGRVPRDWKDKPAKLRQKDRDARWTLVFGKARMREDGTRHADIAIPVFGYKSHAGIDRRHGFIRKWDVTDASRHDGRMLRRGLLDTSNTAATVWADSAYRSCKNEAFLEKRGFRSQVHRRKPKGRAMAPHIRRGNASRSKVRAAVEHVFAQQKGAMGLFVRTVGLARAKVKIGMANLVYNIRRLVWQERRRGLA